jgi:ribosomal protein S12 methylthiotransferase accessory factor
MDDRIMQVTFPGGVRVDAGYKGFVIQTDQPEYAGGTGSAPAPFDLFLASLATCAGHYVLAFCRERKIPAEGIALSMRMERNQETRMIGKITIEISLPSDFPEKYTNAVIRAADHCAVKAHIARPPVFEITAMIRS